MGKFKEGDRVKCMAHGKGTVLANNITDTSHHNDCVLVKFDELCAFEKERYNIYRSSGSSFGSSCNDHITHIVENGSVNEKIVSLLEEVLCKIKK